MSWRTIAIVLATAICTSVSLATVLYPSVYRLSITLKNLYLPLEPCVLNAIFAGAAGLVARWVQSHLLPDQSFIQNKAKDGELTEISASVESDLSR